MWQTVMLFCFRVVIVLRVSRNFMQIKFVILLEFYYKCLSLLLLLQAVLLLKLVVWLGNMQNPEVLIRKPRMELFCQVIVVISSMELVLMKNPVFLTLSVWFRHIISPPQRLIYYVHLRRVGMLTLRKYTNGTLISLVVVKQ